MSGFFATAWTVPCKVSVHGISQARILEWVVISFSRGSFQPRDWTRFSCIGRWILYNWATREAPTYNSMATNTKECPPDFTCVCAKSLQSYLTLCNLRDCSSPGSSVHGILQGLPCPPPGDLPNPGIEPASLMSPALTGGFFTTSAAHIWYQIKKKENCHTLPNSRAWYSGRRR